MIYVLSRYAVIIGALLTAAAGGVRLYAQGQPTAGISGRVLDQDSSRPVEGAIVYIASSWAGVSTPADGSFRISGLPPGTYELVASRVGYERFTQSVTLSDTVSAEIMIRLTPRAVETGGVDIVADQESGGPAAPAYFFPTGGDRQYCIFPTAPTRPIGVLFTDSAFYMYTLDIAVVDSAVYLSLWLLVHNLSDRPLPVDPLRDFSLRAMAAGERAYPDIAPVPPTQAHRMTAVDKATKVAKARIGGALAALRGLQTMIRPGYLHTTGQAIDAAGGNTEDLGGVMIVEREDRREAALPGLSSEYLSTVYGQSFHSGILGNTTVPPKKGIDGVLYFPAPGLLGGEASAAALGRALRFVYMVALRTPDGVRWAAFHAQ